MLTIAASLVGLLGSIFPEILRYFNRKLDLQQVTLNHKHELDLLDAKTRNAEALARLEIDKINVTADATEGDSLRQHDLSISGGFYMDTLRASVRPVLTYFFFFVFVIIKMLAVYHVMSHQDMSLVDALPSIWDEETQALFSAIISFWFGSRTIEKFKRRRWADSNPIGGVY